VIMILRC